MWRSIGTLIILRPDFPMVLLPQGCPRSCSFFTLRTYQSGTQGPVYSVPLKGRAWISADNFQIVRLETDLVASLPQIRLEADHAAIEYGPVHFQSRNLDMWLPQIAEVFYDWRGRRTHRRHSFKNYLLFSVDDKERISE